MLEAAGIEKAWILKLAEELSRWIYTFHMPLFVALSGTIYGIQKEKGKYEEFLPFLKNKAFRLMLPFFVVWIAWNMPIKLFTGYYDGISVSWMFIQMIAPACVYLWFLESLFFVNIIIFFLEKIQDKKIERPLIIVLWMIGVILYQKMGQYHFLGDPLYYLMWFYVGMHVEKTIGYLEEKNTLPQKV